MKTKKNDGYYTAEELKDYNLLTLFNEKLNLKDLGQTPKKWYYDASGYTNINQYTELELKNRNGKVLNNDTVELRNVKHGTTYTATTVYIEPQHYARMIDDYRFDGVVPLYVNFMNDDGLILVWNLAKLKKKPEWKYVTHIWDEGKKIYKDEWRILLEVSECMIYDKDYNLIKFIINDQ